MKTPIDTEKIEIKLLYLKEIITKAQLRYDLYSKEENELQKETLFVALSKFIEEIIESSVIINNEILRSKNSIAGTYFSSFQKVSNLSEFKDKKSKEILLKCASFTKIRNIIVHEYSNIIPKYGVKDYENILYWYKKYVPMIYTFIS